jgi:hypothetical protein
MKKILTTVIFLFSLSIYGQHKMKKLEELINTEDSGWIIVKEWIDSAKNNVVVLPADPEQAKDVLFKTQVTTRSPMGAIVYTTGGILVDHGWIRILGSGNNKLNRSLPEWNKGKTFNNFGENPTYLLIADDAVGGFFMLNGGALGSDLGKIYYFAPDTLEFEPLDFTYTDFLNFCFNNDLDKFYQDLRWKNWRDDVEKLTGDQVFNFFPSLWSKEGEDINKLSKKIITVEEQYMSNVNFRKEIGLTK